MDIQTNNYFHKPNSYSQLIHNAVTSMADFGGKRYKILSLEKNVASIVEDPSKPSLLSLAAKVCLLPISLILYPIVTYFTKSWTSTREVHIHHLLGKSKQLNDRDYATGMTPLMRAARAKDVEALRAIIALGAPTDGKSDNEGRNALMHAVEGIELGKERSLEAIQVLVHAGNSINHRDRNGNTALTYTSDPEVIKMLLKSGAYINSSNTCNETPLMLAAALGQDEKVELLLSLDADPHAENLYHRTALSLAQRNGHQSTAAILQKAMD